MLITLRTFNTFEILFLLFLVILPTILYFKIYKYNEIERLYNDEFEMIVRIMTFFIHKNQPCHILIAKEIYLKVFPYNAPFCRLRDKEHKPNYFPDEEEFSRLMRPYLKSKEELERIKKL